MQPDRRLWLTGGGALLAGALLGGSADAAPGGLYRRGRIPLRAGGSDLETGQVTLGDEPGFMSLPLGRIRFQPGGRPAPRDDVADQSPPPHQLLPGTPDRRWIGRQPGHHEQVFQGLGERS